MPLLGSGAHTRLTERLCLEPITRGHAEDYALVFQDDAVAPWYAGRPTTDEALRAVLESQHLWETVGFHKWLVYERASGTVVGRGGLSAVALDAYGGAIRALLPRQPWVDERMDVGGFKSLARRWCEIGWALRGAYWGRGYAAELGRGGLSFAFGELDMQAVVSYTEQHNLRSRAVMERIGMAYAGEIAGPGLIEGREGVHEGAPFAVYVALRDIWR